MKKYITVMMIIIIILGIVLGIKIMNKEDKPRQEKKNDTLTAEQIRNKILEGLENSNYTYTCVEATEEKTKKVKDNIILAEDSNIKVWINTETREMIIIRENDKVALVTKVKEDSTYLNKDFVNMKTLLNIYNNDLYYVTDEIYNERNCIIIEAGKEKDEKYWIDNETGIILKYQPENGAPTEFKLELNNVTEAEVQKPSIDGYEVSYVEEVV